MEGSANERKFLNALAGPGGEGIKFVRLRSCCAFETENGFMCSSMLDVCEVTWEGQDKPFELSINMYDKDKKIKAPKGFKIR